MTDQKNNADLISELAAFSEQILSICHTEKFFDFIIDKCMEISGCNQASLMIFDYQTQQLQSKKTRGFKE